MRGEGFVRGWQGKGEFWVLSRTVSVALSLRLLNVVVETEEVDPISEWRAALDRASLRQQLCVMVRMLRGGCRVWGGDEWTPWGFILPSDAH